MAEVKMENLPRVLIGFSSVAVSLLLIIQQIHAPVFAIASIYLAIICAVDTKWSKIPNLCNVVLLIVALVYSIFLDGLLGFGLVICGFLVGFTMLLIPYVMGGMGGGDVKALAALGALLGPVTIVQVFLYIALFGGLFSILHYLFSRNFLEKAAGAGRALMAFAGTRDVGILRPATTEKLRFPYASAIAFGFFSYVQWGSIFSLLESF